MPPVRKQTLLSDGIPSDQPIEHKLSQDLPALHPPNRDASYRTLVLLFDGTGDTDDKDPTNVIAIRDMLYGYPEPDPKKQIIYYQTGIGTYDPHFPKSHAKIPGVGSVSGLVDKAIAWSLRHHILDGYEWLIKNYQEGDRICMFGFSRGAYTAQALGAMLGCVGLLPLNLPANKSEFNLKHAKKQAFETYKKVTLKTMKTCVDFIKDWGCRTVTIEFMGVWDAVNSVGLVTAKELPYTTLNRIVKTFRHAVALDEHRARFDTNMWSLPKKYVKAVEEKKTVDGGVGTNGGAQKVEEKVEAPAPPVNPTDHQPNIPFKPDIDQVWFAGCHCDVGGGSVLKKTRPNLAHIPLRWMIREIFRANAGIIFDTTGLASIGLDPRGIYPEVKPRPPAILPSTGDTVKHGPPSPEPKNGWLSSCILDPSSEPKSPEIVDFSRHSEEELDLIDSLAAVYDQLVIKRMQWWLLEIYPLRVLVATEDSETEDNHVRKRNQGKGRNIMTPLAQTATFRGEAVHLRWCKLRIHRSVKTRMKCPGDDGSPYVPKALLGGKTLDKIDPSVIEWVD